MVNGSGILVIECNKNEHITNWQFTNKNGQSMNVVKDHDRRTDQLEMDLSTYCKIIDVWTITQQKKGGMNVKTNI